MVPDSELMIPLDHQTDELLNQRTDVLLDGFDKKAAQEAPQKYQDLLSKYKQRRQRVNA